MRVEHELLLRWGDVAGSELLPDEGRWNAEGEPFGGASVLPPSETTCNARRWKSPSTAPQCRSRIDSNAFGAAGAPGNPASRLNGSISLDVPEARNPVSASAHAVVRGPRIGRSRVRAPRVPADREASPSARQAARPNERAVAHHLPPDDDCRADRRGQPWDGIVGAATASLSGVVPGCR